MRRFRTTDPDFAAAFEAFINERRDTPEDVDASVREVLTAVRRDGSMLLFASDGYSIRLS